MFNKLLAVCCAGFLLAACDQGGDQRKNTDGLTKINTSIYLPGSVGIDFGMPPQSDKTVTEGAGRVRVVTYELAESYKVIDESLSSILISAGYKRFQADKGKRIRVVYRKKNVNPVLVRYSEQVSEGFNRKTLVKIAWSEVN